MKKLLFTPIILLLTICAVYAQHKNSTIRQKVEEGVPTAVLSAIELNQPGLNFQQLAELSPAVAPVAGKKKNIRKARKTHTAPTLMYLVRTTGNNYYKKDLYNQNGELIYSNERIRNTALPLAVRQYIGREYNGWLIKKDVAYRIMNNGTQQKYYKVLVQNGKDKKRLRLTDEGVVYARK